MNNCWGVHSGLVKCILQWCCWQKLNIGADHSNYPSRAPEQWVAFARCAGIFKNTCQSTGIYLHRHGQLRLHDFMHRRMAQSAQHSNWIPLWAWKRMPLEPSARIPCSVARILCFGKLLKSMAPAWVRSTLCVWFYPCIRGSMRIRNIHHHCWATGRKNMSRGASATQDMKQSAQNDRLQTLIMLLMWLQQLIESDSKSTGKGCWGFLGECVSNWLNDADNAKCYTPMVEP